jgi:hypothetical protein
LAARWVTSGGRYRYREAPLRAVIPERFVVESSHCLVRRGAYKARRAATPFGSAEPG